MVTGTTHYAVRLKGYQAELAKKRQVELAGTRKGDLPEKFPEGVGDARDLAAKALGISGVTVDKAGQHARVVVWVSYRSTAIQGSGADTSSQA